MTDPSRIKAQLVAQGHQVDHLRIVDGAPQVVASRDQAVAQAAAAAFVAAERVRPRTPAERLRDLGLDPVRAALVLAARGTPEESTAAEAILLDELARVRRALGRGGEEVTRG